MNLTSAEFWTIVAGVVALALFLGGLIRRGSAVRRRPVVLIHYWWETVLAHDRRVLSPFLTVGTLRPVGDLHRRGSESRKLASRRRDIANGNYVEDDVMDWLLLPGYPLGTRHGQVDGIKVLRVVIHNGSRNKVVSPDEFEFVRFEIGTHARHLHGWRHGRLGHSIASRAMERELEGTHGDWDNVRIEISLPHPLDPGESIRDDLTVSVRGYGADLDPGIKEVRTTSDMRMWIKPWKPEEPWRPKTPSSPERSRALWQIPGRTVRWFRKARKPKAYGRR